MKKNHLALRLTLTPIGMILAVYIVMQVIAYFRDNAILGISSVADLPAYVINFIALYLVPPMVISGGLLYLYARPFDKILARLRSGGRLMPDEAERVRVRMLSFSKALYVLNMVGFVLGYVILVIAEDGATGFFSLYRILILVSNISASCVYAASQSSLANIAFGELRDRLQIHEIGFRSHEIHSSTRNILVGSLLVIYAFTFIEFNGQMLEKYDNLALKTIVSVRDGTNSEEEATRLFREEVKNVIPGVLSRPGLDIESIPLPWNRLEDIEGKTATVFLLHSLFMIFIAILIHVTTALETRDQMGAMSERLKDVLDGEGDLRKRLTLRSMDEYGEQAELINRLLSRFHDMAVRITAAATETREVASLIDVSLHDAETAANEAEKNVVNLAESIVSETASSRALTEALQSFKDAAGAVGHAIDEQYRFADSTAAAMEEMAANIRSVEVMTGRSGSLTEDLAKRGVEGSSAVTETGAAIKEIEASATNVLQVLHSLSKISGDTNLLAMNAAIEAAHAGSSGAGFAVVADEVRKLANNASRETKSIKDLLAAMNGRVKLGVESSNTSGTSLARLADGIAQAAAISREIAEAMREQAKGTAEVELSVTHVVEATEQIRARMDDQDARTQAMGEKLASTLTRLSALAQSSMAEAEAMRRMAATFQAVRSGVDKNLAATNALEKVLSGLKI